MNGPRVTFDGIGLVLGGTEVLSDVTFAVEPGELHALVGPNGGGKTSLLRCLLGQMPHRGAIRIDWQGAPGRIGYVPQSIEFDRDLPVTVDDFLALAVQRRIAAFGLARRHRAAVDRALDLVGMTARRRRRMGALSGGERQRVLVAQALVPSPDLLLLDEPMAGVDTAGAALIADIVTGLRDRGTTVIWVHHDMAEVRRIADRVTRVAGRVVWSGTAAVLDAAPLPATVA